MGWHKLTFNFHFLYGRAKLFLGTPSTTLLQVGHVLNPSLHLLSGQHRRSCAAVQSEGRSGELTALSIVSCFLYFLLKNQLSI